jgi:hypothetical protein
VKGWRIADAFSRLLKRTPPSSSPDEQRGRQRAAMWQELFERRGLVWTQRVLVTPATTELLLAEAERLEAADARTPRASHDALLATIPHAATFIASGCVPPLDLQPSASAAGLGVFASAQLPALLLIGNYSGQLRRVEDVAEQGAYAHEAWPDAPVAVDAAVHGNQTRFVNHGAEPNIGVIQCVVGRQWHVFYATLRPIELGEELLVDYGREYWRKRPRPRRR